MTMSLIESVCGILHEKSSATSQDNKVHSAKYSEVDVPQVRSIIIAVVQDDTCL